MEEIEELNELIKQFSKQVEELRKFVEETEKIDKRIIRTIFEDLEDPQYKE